MHRQRRITPPVYNERRLEETPIPRLSIQPRNSDDMEVGNSADSVEDIAEHRNKNFIEAADAIHSIEIVAEHNNENNMNADGSVDNIATVGVQNNENPIDSVDIVEVNNFGPRFTPTDSAYDIENFGKDALPVDGSNDPLELKLEVLNASIEGDGDTVEKLVACNFEIIDEDVAIYYDDEKAFIPKGNRYEVKRNDIFSGNIPFIEYAVDKSVPGEKVDRGFMIECDGEMKEIRIKAEYIQKFVEWNTVSNDSLMDSRYVATLMAICIGKTNLRFQKLNPNIIDFIRCKFLVVLFTYVLKKPIHLKLILLLIYFQHCSRHGSKMTLQGSTNLTNTSMHIRSR